MSQRAAALPPEERRRAIVEALVPLIAERGGEVSTREIAEAAGVAEGTIFRAFADKDALLLAVLDAALDPEPFEQAIAAIAADASLADAVTAAVQLSQRRVTDSWRLLSRLGHRLPDGGKRPMAESAALTRLLEAHRDELTISPRAAARTLRAFTFAMTHPLLAERPTPPRDIARLFLHGATEGRPC